MNYSVLMAVYAKENPQFLKASIESMLAQTIPTDDFVIVKDGPLPACLEEVLQIYHDHLHLISLARNVGLGPALGIGLASCKHELVARMDSDDLSRPQRIAKQLAVFAQQPECVLCGGYIEEFIEEPGDLGLVKKVPIETKDIFNFIKRRNPFNHVTVMFKKNAIMQAGNYQSFYFNEDYELWIRVLSSHPQVTNLAECLCDVRVGNGMFERRGGWKYLKYDYALQKKLLNLGMTSPLEMSMNVALRSAVRLMPSSFRKHVYTHFLRQNQGKNTITD